MHSCAVRQGYPLFSQKIRPTSFSYEHHASSKGCATLPRSGITTGDKMDDIGGNALKPRQRRFVDEYLVDLNATQAAIRAGYSARTANEQGARLLAKAIVAAAVQAAQKARAERLRITQDDVLLGLQREARLTGVGTSHAARVSAWGLLGKHLGMFTDRTQQLGPDGKPIDPRPTVTFVVQR